MAHCEEVIVCTTVKGKGTDRDVKRTVTQIYNKEGRLLGEYDPVQPEYDPHEGTWILHKDTIHVHNP